MLLVKKEFTFYDLVKLYEELKTSKMVHDLDCEGLGIVYDHLTGFALESGEAVELVELVDFLRRDLEVMTEKELIKNYDIEGDILAFIDYNSYLIGKYQKEGEIIYLFYAF